MADQQRILITGAAGGVGTLLRPRLGRAGRTVRLLDVQELERPPGEGEEFVKGTINDLDAMTEACQGVAAVVHLAGQSVEADVDTVVVRNVRGTYALLEAARRAGVPRVILASSNHAVGFHHRDQAPPGGLPADAPPRPDTLYGWSKVAVEAAGRLYHDRYGMDVICLRIGSWFDKPPGIRGLVLWLSPDDGARLVEASLATPDPGYRIVWGVSRNTRGWLSLAEGEAIGYHPEDDSEAYAAELIAEHGEPDFDNDPALNRVGGQWCDVPLGVPMS
ncbi:MAG: NAD-dependent epimerase/dehydratase family protein [Micromonosporaceae bacterium]